MFLKFHKIFRVYKKHLIFAILFLSLFILFKFVFSNHTPTIFVITATYARYEQLAELHRLKNTFLHISQLHWIVVEDSRYKTNLVKNFLEESGIPYTHLFALTPNPWKIRSSEPFWSKPKGIAQRNTALNWIRQNYYKFSNKAAVYFADDDNSYSIRLFEEMRYTKVVSTWPVGLAGELPWEGCVGNGKGGVSRFWVAFKPERQFPVDMAGFAINIDLILKHTNVLFSYNVSIGYQESLFLSQLNVTLSQLESKANDCKQILVWHLRTAKPLMREGFKLAANGIRSPQILDEFYSEFS